MNCSVDVGELFSVLIHVGDVSNDLMVHFISHDFLPLVYGKVRAERVARVCIVKPVEISNI